MNDFFYVIHVLFGVLAIISGFLSMAFRKGGLKHIRMGMVFYITMLGMAGSATYLALFKSQEAINAVIGLFTMYLVITSRWTISNRSGKVTIREKMATALSFALFATFLILTYQANASGESVIDGVYVEAFYVYTVLAFLALALDLVVLLRRGIIGAQRIARHLWRMLLALFIATASLFMGQPQVFPVSLQNSGILNIPVLIVVLFLLFWLVRVYSDRRFKRT